MAKLLGHLRLNVAGLENCKASIQSIGEATQNACLDLDLDWSENGLLFEGMKIYEFAITSEEGLCFAARMRPTAGMMLFAAWLMTRLPSSASVTWRDGWPFFYCPPNDDADYEDDPTPLIPNQLVPA